MSAFSAEGARVIGFDLAPEGLAALADEVPGVQTGVGDVTNPGDVQRAVDTAEGRLDALCDSAGLLDELRFLVDELDLALWNRVLAVNVTGPFLLAREQQARRGRADANIAATYREQGIRANSICPSTVRSDAGGPSLASAACWSRRPDVQSRSRPSRRSWLARQPR